MFVQIDRLIHGGKAFTIRYKFRGSTFLVSGSFHDVDDMYLVLASQDDPCLRADHTVVRVLAGKGVGRTAVGAHLRALQGAVSEDVVGQPALHQQLLRTLRHRELLAYISRRMSRT